MHISSKAVRREWWACGNRSAFWLPKWTLLLLFVDSFKLEEQRKLVTPLKFRHINTTECICTYYTKRCTVTYTLRWDVNGSFFSVTLPSLFTLFTLLASVCLVLFNSAIRLFCLRKRWLKIYPVTFIWLNCATKHIVTVVFYCLCNVHTISLNKIDKYSYVIEPTE